MKNLPFFFGLLQKLPNFATLDHFDCGIMELVKIDVISLKPLQAFLENTCDVGAREVPFSAFGASHNISALGGENHFVSSSSQIFTKQSFGVAGAIGI